MHLGIFYSIISERLKASQAQKKLSAIHGNEYLKGKECQNRFAKFCSDEISLKKKRNDLAVQLKLMKLISRLLSI